MGMVSDEVSDRLACKRKFCKAGGLVISAWPRSYDLLHDVDLLRAPLAGRSSEVQLDMTQCPGLV